MNLTDKIQEFNISPSGVLSAKDKDGRVFESSVLNPTDFVDGDSLASRKKLTTASVSLQTELVNIEAIQQNIIPMEIVDLYVDGGTFYAVVHGLHQIEEGSLIISGAGGFNVGVNIEWFIIGYEESGTDTIFTLISTTTVSSGTWNSAGTLFYFGGYYIQTETAHGLTGSAYIYIQDLTGFTPINATLRQSTVISATVLYISSSYLLGIIYSSSTYTSGAQLKRNNIARLTFDTTDFVDTTVIFRYADPLIADFPTQSNAELYNTAYNVINKTTTYIDIDIISYMSAIDSTSITFYSTELVFSSAIATGETVELVLLSGKRKRFKTITDAFKEYDGGQIRVYNKSTAYDEQNYIATNHLNMYVEQGAILSFDITGALNKNLIIEGEGTFEVVNTHGSNTTGIVRIKGHQFRSLNLYATSDNVYVDVDRILLTGVSTGSLAIGYNHGITAVSKALYLNFNEIINEKSTSSLVINGNAFINGNSIEQKVIGHCLVVHGSSGTKCIANIKRMKTTMNLDSALAIYSECVTLESTGTSDMTKELHLTFDLIELSNIGSPGRVCSACATIQGKMFLYNGTIISSVNAPAVSYASFASGGLKNVKIQNTAGIALALTSYNVSPYLTTPIEVVNCDIEGNSTNCAVGIGIGTGSSNSGGNTIASISRTDIKNIDTSAGSSAIKLGSNVVSLELDDVLLVTGHASAKCVDKLLSTITAVTKAANAVITSAEHGITSGQTIKIIGVVGMTELNGNSYTIVSVTTDTITINVDSTGFTTYTSGGQLAVPKNLAIKRPLTMKVAKESDYSTYTENSSAVSVIANLT